MFSTIVIGIDGRRGGWDALALARALAGPSTQLVAVYAWPYEPAPARWTRMGTQEELGQQAAAELRRWVRDTDVERRVVADTSPGRALHVVATEIGADLIVVGSAHHGRLGRVLLGDVARSTIHRSPCAVAIAPRGYRETAGLIRVVGTGYLDTPEGTAAFRAAVGLAAEREARVRVLTAVPPFTPIVYSTAYTFDWRGHHEENMRAARRTLEALTGDLDLAVVCDVSDEPPGEALVKLSSVVDLIVAGSRGWGPVRTVLLGSASDKLAHEARCPVLLVPAAAHDTMPPLEVPAEAAL